MQWQATLVYTCLDEHLSKIRNWLVRNMSMEDSTWLSDAGEAGVPFDPVSLLRKPENEIDDDGN